MKIKNLGALPDDRVITVKLITDSKLTQDQFDTLTNILSANNLTIVNKTDLFVDIRGMSQNLSKLFNTTINQFHNKKTNHKYFSHENKFSMPKELNFVTDVMGLCTKPIARTYHHVIKHDTPSELISFTPIQVAQLYNFPRYTGVNEVISLIELGGGFSQDDLTYYFNSLGLESQPTIISVSVDSGSNNYADIDASGEVMLDIQICSSVAPDAKIVVYFAPNTNTSFYNAIYEAIHDNYHSSIISISWGSSEVNWPRATMLSFDKLFAVAVSKGINIFVASGDNGSGDASPGENVDFPASSPHTISCGGTHLDSDGITIQNETAWNDEAYGGSGSGGGGYSKIFNKPAYQNGISAIKTKRGVPDISGNASPYTGYQIYMNGSFSTIGGTSGVAPLYSALTARVNEAHGKSVGFINPQLYHNKPCVDITSGNNGFYHAGSGWDPVTGLGRIRGELAITKL